MDFNQLHIEVLLLEDQKVLGHLKERQVQNR